MDGESERSSRRRVKLQQPRDKSFSLSLCRRLRARDNEAEPAESETDPGCLLSPELPASPHLQASDRKYMARRDTLTDTYAEGLAQLTGGPPNLAGTNTHSCSLLDCTHTLAVLSSLRRINRINPAMLV